jgi:hypothetical protein
VRKVGIWGSRETERGGIGETNYDRTYLTITIGLFVLENMGLPWRLVSAWSEMAPILPKRSKGIVVDAIL